MDRERLLHTVRRDAHFAALIVAALIAPAAQAAVTISSAATQNMSCSGGICAPTAKTAVLNADDLETLLASGNVTVTTTGSGVQADAVHVSSVLGWSNSNTLAFEAHRSIAIDAPVSIAGLSGLTLDTGKDGTLSFGKKGNVTFANLASQLTINGAAYTLVGDIKTLASDIALNPGGDFALANSYDASGDGGYLLPPVSTVLTGTFEGLGNVISNLFISGAWDGTYGEGEGLFYAVAAPGALRDVALVNATVLCSRKYAAVGALASVVSVATVWASYATGKVGGSGKGRGFSMGGLVGENGGTIENSYAAVALSAKKSAVGGLVSSNEGTITGSHATGAVSGGGAGLVADNYGTVSDSFATGAVTGPAGAGLVGVNDGGTITGSFATGNVRITGKSWGVMRAAGLVLDNGGTIANSYSTGAVTGADASDVGGLVGLNASPISYSYSTGSVSGETGSLVGGLIGDDEAPSGSLDDTYWDTDTSGITNLSQGAGNIDDDPGITGLTTEQFQSGLPAGFDPKVWAEEPNINGGLPYLLANPPPKHE
jgi:hypothetical protein